MGKSKDKLTIRRGTREVENLLDALGPLKETRLTAFVAYLFHLNPELPKKLFNLPLAPNGVSIEHQEGGDRFDIILSTHFKAYVVEAKLGKISANDRRRYSGRAKPHCLIANDIDSASSSFKGFFKVVTWDEVYQSIEITTRSKRKCVDGFYRGLAAQVLEFLEEKNMTKRDFKDVYIRDLSGPSVDLYFNKNFYHAQAKFFTSASKARYFAPFLTKSNMKGDSKTPFRALGVGISYFSKIESIKLIKRKELRSYLRANGYSAKDAREIDQSKAIGASPNTEVMVLLLGKALRLCQAPITKSQMWTNGHGAMPSMTIDFTDLIGCANGIPLPKKKKVIKKRKTKKKR